MKKYALFAGYKYYPVGGWGDFVCLFDEIDECKEKVKVEKTDNLEEYYDWAHLVDLENGEIVWFHSKTKSQRIYITMGSE